MHHNYIHVVDNMSVNPMPYMVPAHNVILFLGKSKWIHHKETQRKSNFALELALLYYQKRKKDGTTTGTHSVLRRLR